MPRKLLLFRCPQSQTNNALLSTHGAPPPLPSPPRPLLHFSSHRLCSSPFLLCCGSSDRGIPSLLMPPMGWCAQMKTMYSNGSAKLPQFPANAGGVHVEVRSRQFQKPRGVGVGTIAACSGCSWEIPATSSKLILSPLLIHKAPPLGLTVAQKLHAASAWKIAWAQGEWGAAKKGVF